MLFRSVGGYLDLSSLTSIPEGFNPTVGGSLDLRSLTSIPEGFNPTVGGSLDLSSLTSIPEGFNPTVGGYLDLRRERIEIGKETPIMRWQDGRYCCADGILGEVVLERRVDNANIYKIKKINKDEVFYLVEKDGKTAHGDSVKTAMIDLRFKTENRDKSDYEDLTPDSELSFEDAVVCYRVITGACSFGVADFLKNRLSVNKDRYTVGEIISLTVGEYGCDTFMRFLGLSGA